MSANAFISVPHRVVQWAIDVGASFADLRVPVRDGSAVPAVDTDRMAQRRDTRADRVTVLSAAWRTPPHGFIRIVSADVDATTQLAGARPTPSSSSGMTL